MPQSALDGVLRDGYDTGGFYDEAFEHGPNGVAVPRAHYAQLVAQIASIDGRGPRGGRRSRQPLVPAPGGHLHRLFGRRSRHRADLAVRPHPAHRSGR